MLPPPGGPRKQPPFEIVLTPQRLAESLGEMAAARLPAVSLPFLGARDLDRLRRTCRRLTFRRARPMVGEGARQVTQDFELTDSIPARGLLRDLATQLDDLSVEALAWPTRAPTSAIAPALPLAQAPRFNDIVVQRYATGSSGISPHRDHLRYTGLVALITVSGRARLFTCADRSGRDPREVDIAPGRLVLLPAPGFANSAERPFHFLTQVESRRVSLGLRQDSWANRGAAAD